MEGLEFEDKFVFFEMHYHSLLLPDGVYHIFNRAIGNEKLFKEQDNYRYFLDKYVQHLSPVVETLCWCLLPNHFHMMVRIKSVEVISKHFREKKNADLIHNDQIPEFLMERFSNWLNSYTKSFNKVYNRKGSLFIDYMRRVEVSGGPQFCSTLFYIHKNPVHHSYCKHIEEWTWSSYKEYIYNKQRIIQPKEVLLEFGSLDEFVKFHQQPVDLKTPVVIE